MKNKCQLEREVSQSIKKNFKNNVEIELDFEEYRILEVEKDCSEDIKGLDNSEEKEVEMQIE